MQISFKLESKDNILINKCYRTSKFCLLLIIISIFSSWSPSLTKLSYSNFKYSSIDKSTFPLEIGLDIVDHVNIISNGRIKRTVVVSLIQSGPNLNIPTAHLEAETERTGSPRRPTRLLSSKIYPNLSKQDFIISKA